MTFRQHSKTACKNIGLNERSLRAGNGDLLSKRQENCGRAKASARPHFPVFAETADQRTQST